MPEKYNCCANDITKTVRFYRTLVAVSIGMLLILGIYMYNYYGEQSERINLNFEQHRKPGKLEDRKKHLLWACQSLREKNMTGFQEPLHILGNMKAWAVSDRYKLLSCRIRKVGSTNIARVLHTLDHLMESTDTNKASKGRARDSVALKIGKRNTADYESDLEKLYTKFVFVRDPFERLVSAYRDHRPTSWFKPNGLSFKNFLEKVVQNSNKRDNMHIVSYTKFCNPCSVKYDIIGLLNNYEHDMRSVLRAAGVNEVVVLPVRNQTGYRQEKTGDDVTKAYLSSIPKSLIKKVYEKYYFDYYLFGFTKPDF